MTTGQLLETVTVVTPFGFRLWDAAIQRSVSDGLDVSCSWDGGRPRQLAASPSGVFQLGGGSAFAEFARGRGDAAFWAHPPAVAGRGVVRVVDVARRYLPFSFTVEPPPPRISGRLRDLCNVVAGSPDDPMPRLALFSAASRVAPASTAMALGQLRTVDGKPVIGALVKLSPPNSPAALGLSDAAGNVAIFFPYPKPADTNGPGAAPSPRLPLAKQTWNIGLKVFARGGSADDGYPDLCDVLDQGTGPAAHALADVGSNQDLTSVELSYDRVLALQTRGVSELLIEPV